MEHLTKTLPVATSQEPLQHQYTLFPYTTPSDLPAGALCQPAAGADRGPDRPAQEREAALGRAQDPGAAGQKADRKSTRLNSSHPSISYAVFCFKKKH